MMPELLYEQRVDFEDGAILEIVLWHVPSLSLIHILPSIIREERRRSEYVVAHNRRDFERPTECEMCIRDSIRTP